MAHVRWAAGGEADLVLFQGEKIELRSSTSAAPGTPLEGTLEGGAALRVKVHGCRREGDAFRIHGRTLDLRRDLRAQLEGLLEGKGPQSETPR